VNATVQEYYRRVDAHDVEGLLELFAEDARYERPGYDPLVGRPALRQFYAGARVIESGAHTIARVVEARDNVAVEGRFSGELKDGRHVDLGFADFFVLSGQSIVGRRTYFYAPLV
jgi:ketosteroid isomerase-like protein